MKKLLTLLVLFFLLTSQRVVDGQHQATIDSPNSLTTRIRDLKPGVYEFELMVTFEDGRVGRDTVKVTVLPDTTIIEPAPKPTPPPPESKEPEPEVPEQPEHIQAVAESKII